MKKKKLFSRLKKGIGLLAFLGIVLLAGLTAGNWYVKHAAEKKILDDQTALSDRQDAGDCIRGYLYGPGGTCAR